MAGFFDIIRQIVSDVFGYSQYDINDQNIEANRYLADMQRWFNHDEAEIQRQWDLQMWQMNNEYNSPAAQMQRARDAGLNPSLIYGQPISEASPATGSSAASAGLPHVNLGANQGSLLNLFSVITQAEKARADARLAMEQAESESSMRSARIANLNASTAEMSAGVEDIVSKIQQRAVQNQLTTAEIDNIKFDQMIRNQQIQIDWKRLANETDMTAASIDKLRADFELALANANVANRQFQEMCWTYAIRYAGLESQVGLTQAKIAEAEATARHLAKEDEQIAQLLAKGKPDAVWLSTLGSNMAGENGKFHEIGSIVTYSILQLINSFGGALLKN